MTRYNLFKKISELCKLEKTGKDQYNKIILSGKLAETHWDYGTGYYDVCIYYYKRYDGKHFCRVWFGTIDDGDFGSWTECNTKEEALKLVEEVAHMFKDITILPSYKDLNLLFKPIGVYFKHE